MTHYEKLDILTSNQKEFRGRGDIANEQRALTLSEIARTLCEDNEGEALSEIVRKYAELTAECSPADSIILCRELLLRKRSADELKRITAIGEGEETAAGTHGKIAYPKNKFNDAAFEHLSLAVSTPRAVYTSSINAACEAVAEGSCEFCILPIENSLDGKLFGFYSLLDRFELKICAVCDIDGDGDSHIRYALIGRGCREPIERIAKSTPFILEFFVLDSDGDFLDGLLPAAKACNAQLISIDTRPVPYDTQSKKFILSFRVSRNDSLLLRTFLTLYYDSYSPIGLYPYIQN
jgi:hypothetical protein